MEAKKKNYVGIGVKIAVALAVFGLVIKLLAPFIPHIILLGIVLAAPSILKELRHEKSEPTVEELFPAITMEEWRSRAAKEKEVTEAGTAGAAVSAHELKLCRAKVSADITACAESGSATWRWANPNTATKVYLTFDANPSGIFEGTIQMEGERVVGISIPTPEGTKMVPNTPYLEAKRAAAEAEQAARKAAAAAQKDMFQHQLNTFFATRKDGARITVANLNPEQGTFTMSGPMGKFSVTKVKAHAEFLGENIVSVEFQHKGKSRTIRRGKQHAATVSHVPPAPAGGHPTPSAAPQSPDLPAPTPVPEEGPSLDHSSTPQTAEPAAPTKADTPAFEADVETKPEHARAPDFHQPCGLTADALERHVKLYADAAAASINSAAMSAYNSGEQFCLVEFPEGLHTFDEVNTFGRLLADTYNFTAYEILEDQEAIKLQLGEVDQDNDSGLLALVDDMAPILSNEAADLYETTGAVWLTASWPQEIDNIKAANEFCRLLLAQSNFDDYGVDPAGKLRLHLAVKEVLAPNADVLDDLNDISVEEFDIPEEADVMAELPCDSLDCPETPATGFSVDPISILDQIDSIPLDAEELDYEYLDVV